ncbi:serine protease, partial [Micromonospora musae]|uniref:S1 family peptidase n=1 Tax=Micromonospora musae TaxID=1894970 RepID=UPI00340EC674
MGQVDPLDADADASWEECLQAATVAIEVPSATGAVARRGTGFFIAPGIVATCAHVLTDNEQPLPELMRGRVVAAKTQMLLRASADSFFRTAAGLDLALLKVEEITAVVEPPPVLPSPVVDVGDVLWTYGHPDNMFRAGQPASFVYEGQSRRGEEDALRLMRLRGTPVTGGFSGSPVVNRRTGAVCGMICTSGPSGSSHMLPISEILSRCEPARLALVTAPVMHRRWLAVLSDEQLAAGQWRFPGPQLRAYIAMAARTGARHPYRLSPGTQMPPLSAVYVRQATRIQDQSKTTAVPAPVRPAEVVFEGHADAFLVGGAGAGKSS